MFNNWQKILISAAILVAILLVIQPLLSKKSSQQVPVPAENNVQQQVAASTSAPVAEPALPAAVSTSTASSSAAGATVQVVSDMDSFVQCLAARGMTFYGASWCPHCQAQKALFGQSVKYLNYVECPDNPQACIDKGVEAYPTWIDSAGAKHEGEQTIDQLSQLSGCELKQ
jgi:thiol-disulfide isomerase/thioredoxin